MNPFGILADDLTGACDTGVQFSRRGARVVVLAAPEGLAAVGGTKWDVVVLDTQSRHLPAADASARVREGLERLAAAGYSVRYKKIDSTLRGNLLAELEPLAAAGARRIVVAPAFPLAGRTVADGVLLVGGRPVHETEIGHDRLTPVAESHLPTLLARGLGVPVAVRSPADAEGFRPGSGDERVIVPDTATQDDLAALARIVLPVWQETVVVGSAGMARELAATLLPQGREPERAAPAQAAGGPVLVVAGSRTQVTRRQVNALAAEPETYHLVISPRVFDWSKDTAEARAWQEAQLELLARAARQGVRRLVVSLERQEGDGAEGERAWHARSQRINEALGGLISGACAALQPCGLLLTGGDIARAALEALGIRALQLGPEVLPGIPLGWAVDGAYPGLPLVTKAGGFGEPDALRRAADVLLEQAATAGRTRTRGEDMQTPPVLGITLGDPAGIGAEVALKAMTQHDYAAEARLLLIGEQEAVRAQLAFAGEGFTLHVAGAPGEARWEPGVLNLLDIGVLDAPLAPGELSPRGGEAAFRALERGIALSLAGELAGIVTAPLNKEALHLAGHKFDGHTEILGHFCGKVPTYMLLSSERLKIVHVSTHCSLREACDRAKQPRVLSTIRALHEHLEELGASRPQLGVAGLNPHSGEHGLFGTEEIDEIVPAIEAARAEGIDALGPVPPDTLYLKAYRGGFDSVVAMYHDQGHIPQKLVAFEEAVNVTLGLPMIRTAVDHGTAFDIAGKGVADPTNMVKAIAYALRMAEARAGLTRS